MNDLPFRDGMMGVFVGWIVRKFRLQHVRNLCFFLPITRQRDGIEPFGKVLPSQPEAGALKKVMGFILG